MFPIIGLVVVFGMVFGGFMLAGGHFEVIIEAAPMEFMMIFGAAVGALIISNDMNGFKGVVGGFASGFLHPLNGWDHVIAMVAVAVPVGALRAPAPPAQVAVPQRNCACGQRTEGDAECEECRKKSETLRRRSAPP